MTATTGLVTESAETLAEALHGLGGCKRCQWAHENRWPCGSADRYRDEAQALIASGAVRPEGEVRAEAWDEGWEDRDGDCSEPFSPRKLNPYRAAMAEEGGDRG